MSPMEATSAIESHFLLCTAIASSKVERAPDGNQKFVFQSSRLSATNDQLYRGIIWLQLFEYQSICEQCIVFLRAAIVGLRKLLFDHLCPCQIHLYRLPDPFSSNYHRIVTVFVRYSLNRCHFIYEHFIL